MMELQDIPYWEYFEQGMRSNWELCEVWVDGDYPGSVAALGRTPYTDNYFWVEWDWGTREGCDGWKALDIEPSAIVESIWETNTPTTPEEFSSYVEHKELRQVWGRA